MVLSFLLFPHYTLNGPRIVAGLLQWVIYSIL
jgi:hypothetical protein